MDTTPHADSPEPIPARPLSVPGLGLLALGAVLLLSIALRWHGLSRGYTSDEVSLVLPWTFFEVLTDGESAVNPPWFAACFNAIFESHQVVQWGRRVSFVSGIAAVALAFCAGRTAGNKSLFCGLAAATLVAIHPWAILQSSMFRVYSITLAVGLWHIWSLLSLVQSPGSPRKGWAVQVLVSALLLTQLHYFWVPVLGALALGLVCLPSHRRAAWLYLPAALLFLPWFLFMLRFPERQNPTGFAGALESLQMMAQLGSNFGKPIVPCILGLYVLCFKGLTPAQRILGWGAAAVLLATGLLGIQQMVRPPVSLFLLAFLGPMLAASISLVSRLKPPFHFLHPLSVGLALIGMGTQSAWTYGLDVTAPSPRDGLLHAQREWPRWLADYEPDVVVVTPSFQLPVLHLYLEGLPISQRLATPRCPEGEMCFDSNGVLVTSDFAQLDATPGRAVVLSTQWRHPAPPTQCFVQRSQPGYALWQCTPRGASQNAIQPRP